MGFNLPKREQISHKGSFGKVLNIAGSRYMPGAAYLSSVSALKTGCGYCFLASEEKVIDAVAAQTQNIVFLPLKEIKNQKPDVVSIGCGLTTSRKAKKILKETAANFQNIPIIIDADGLNILSKTDIKLPSKVILTPHYKEASRLLDINVDIIAKEPERYAKEITKKYNCVTILKGHPTIVVSRDFDVYTNTTGNSALAKAGSGDVLTGIISGLVAQGMDMYEAAKLGVYLHGKCGELASEKLTEYSVMAEDLISFIPESIKYFINQRYS